MQTYAYVIYQLEDSGSHYRIAALVLYPGVPVPAASIADWFLPRLLEERIVARCDADGNLAPEGERYIEPVNVTEDPFEDSSTDTDDTEGELSDLPDPDAPTGTATTKRTRKSTGDTSQEG